MPVAEALPDTIVTAAKALGVLDAAGDLNAGFFERPLHTIGAALTDPGRRKTLLDALPVLVGDAETAPHDGGERRTYPLISEDEAEIALTVDLAPAAAGPDVTLGVAVSSTLQQDATGTLTAALAVPLVRAAGTTLEAVCGMPVAGPLRLELAYAMADGLTVSATAAAHSGGGWIAARVAGLVVNGHPIAPLEVRSDELAGDALTLFHQLLRVAAALLGDAAGQAGVVLENLPALLGLEDPALALPIVDLLSGRARWRDWFAALSAGPAAGLRIWLESVAALLGVTLGGTLTSAPTESDPWILPLHEGLPDLALTVMLATDTAGLRRLGLGLRASMVAPAPADARLQVEVAIVDLPLAGALSEAWFARGTVLLVTPHADGQRLAPPGPIGTGPPPSFAVGTLRAGVRWTGAVVEPTLELDDVRVDGRDYHRLDLTDADTLSDTVSDLLEQRLCELLGASAVAEALLVLAGLEETAGRRVDLGLFATAPTRAIAEHHRALLESGDWAATGGPLRRLAGLLGVADTVVREGTGTDADPWRLPLVENGLRLLLTASTADDGARRLDLGLRLERREGATGPTFNAALRLLSISFGTPSRTAALDRAALSVGTGGLQEGPVTLAGASLDSVWSAQAGLRVGAALHGVTVLLPGEDGEPSAVALGDLTLLPWTFDPGAPDLGLGVDIAALPRLAAWAAQQLAGGLDPLGAALVETLGDSIETVLGDPPSLGRLVDDPAAVARVALVALASDAAESPLLAALAGDVAAAAGALLTGAGSHGEPWRWIPDPGATGVALTAWLAPAGPRAAVPSEDTSIWADAAPVDLDPLAALAQAATEGLGVAATLDRSLTGLVAGRDLGAIGDGLALVAGFCSSGDGLLPASATAAPAGWGAALAAAAPLTSPFADAAAVAAVAGEIDGWGGGPLVLISPAWWQPGSWEPLVSELATRHADWAWAEVDLRRDPLGALGGIAPADAYVVLSGADPGAQPAGVLDRIAGLHPGARPVLAAVDPGAPLLAWVGAHRDALGGLLALGLRTGPDADVARWDRLAEAVRIIEPLLRDDALWGPLVRAWRELADGQTAPDAGRPAQTGRLQASALAAAPALPDLATLPRRVLTATASGEYLLRALADALSRTVEQPLTPDALVTGLSAPVPLPVSAGPVRADVAARLDLGRYGLRADAGAGAAVVVTATLGRSDGGWLTGPPAATRTAAVRRVAITVRAPLGGGDAEVVLELQDGVLAGLSLGVCTPADAGFVALLSAVLEALPSGDAHVDAALGLAGDLLGIVVPAGTRWQLDTNALDVLLSDPAATLAARARARLGSGLLGFAPDAAAPPGVRRLARTLSSQLEATIEPAAGLVRVTTVGDGVAIGADGRLRFAATVATADGALDATWALTAGGVTLERTGTGTLQLVLPDDPARPVVLAPAPDPAELAARLAARLPPILAASLVSAALEQWTGTPVPASTLVPWFVDPVRTLSSRFDTGSIAVAAIEVGRALGLPVAPDGAVTLIPGVLTLQATVAADGVRLLAATPAGDWSPAPGLRLGLQAGLRIDAAGVAAPAGRVALRVDLDQASGSQGWGELGLTVTYDGSAPSVALLPGSGAPIELVPRFAGFGALVDATVERFVPRVLDELVTAVPAGALKQQALAIAGALEVYGTSFADAPVPLRELDLARLRARAPQVAATLTPLAQELLSTAAGTTVTVSSVPGGVRASLAGAAGGTLALTVTIGGEVAVAVALDDLALGPVGAGVTVQAASTPAGVALSGAAAVTLALEDALRVTPGPELSVSLAADGTLSAALLPLPDQPAGKASIDILPTPRVQIAPDARALLAVRWLVTPGLDVLVRLLAERGVLEQPVITGGPTWTAVLEAAGLVQDGRVSASLDPASLPGAALAFADEAKVNLTDDLVVRVAREGPAAGPVDVGLALTGTIPIDAGGDVAPAIVLGELGQGGQPDTGGLEVLVLQGAASTWTIAPKLRFARTGVRATGPLGRDLLAAGPLSLGGVEGRLDLTAALALGGGAASVQVSGLGAELWARGLGLPGMGKGSGNPVAGSLLAPAAGAASTVNPKLDIGLRYAQASGLELKIGGLAPGETLWVPINQTFGPLHIAQVGVRSDSASFAVPDPPSPQTLPYVGLLVDGAVELGPLALAVKGLGVQIPARYAGRPSVWRLQLDGLAVAFDGAGVTIAGGLEKGESGGVLEYRGFLQVRAFGFGASAIGAYADLAGTPSFYAFAAISAPLGGPPYLFITGLAGGLGFNRTLRTPSTPEQVPAFPLVAIMREGGAVNPDQLLARMADAIRPAAGSYWFAAGLTFTTFELLKSVALGYLAITPAGLEIGLLGLMSAAVPTEDEKLANLELGLIARYSSADQTLAVLAQLTRNSWLFTENCRLTGGFAFMVWFGKPQVVLTVGGYGPLYEPPSYFPQVPELGFRWQVSDDIVIKGGSYYAVTPEVMTVGGRLEAAASFTGGHANVCVYAHAAMWFWPPHFALNLGFRATGKIFGFGFDVGCDVLIELPPLWGRVTVYFMGEHRFYFGTREIAQQFLAALGDFVRDFLGGPEQVHKLDVPAGLVVPDRRAGAGSSGASRPAGTATDPWRVTPEFTLTTTTALPSVEARLNGQAVGGVPGAIASLHALPLSPGLARLNPTHTVEIVRAADGVAVPAGRVTPTATRSGVPTGIYGVNGGSGSFHPPTQGSAPTQGKAQLDAAIGGLQVTAATQLTASPGAGVVNLPALVDELAPGTLPEEWGLAAPPVPAAAAPAPPAAPEAPRPMAALRWSTVASSWDADGSREVMVAGGETQLWDLPHDRPATRFAPRGPVGRVVALDPMGDVLHDEEAAERHVPGHAASLVVGAPPAGRAAGWEAATPLLPVTRWVFVAPGATVELPTIAWWPAALAAHDGVPAHRAVVPDAGGAATRFARDSAVDTVVVTLDARVAGAGLADVAVAAEGGRLGDPAVLRDQPSGRLTLVYPVSERADDELLTVSVVVDRRAWALAGTVGLPGDAADWRARIEAAPWTPLLAAADGAGTERLAAGTPAAAAFALVYEDVA